MIEVVAALIFRDGRLLVCQRSAAAAHPLKWEFPGGKLEAGENDEDALRRELREELNVDIDGVELVHRQEHRYAGGPEVALRFYRIGVCSGEMQNRVFERIAWVKPAELGKLDFLDGDRAIVQRLCTEPESFLPLRPASN